MLGRNLAAAGASPPTHYYYLTREIGYAGRVPA